MFRLRQEQGLIRHRRANGRSVVRSGRAKRVRRGSVIAGSSRLASLRGGKHAGLGRLDLGPCGSFILSDLRGSWLEPWSVFLRGVALR